MANNLKSALINFLRCLPRWTLAGCDILTLAINVMMHYVSALHKWVIIFGLGCLVSGCQVHKLSVKCMKGYKDDKGRYRHHSGVLPFRYMSDPPEHDCKSGLFVQLYHMNGFIVIPTTILSQVPKEIQNDFKTYFIENMNRYYEEIMRNVPTANDELRKLIDKVIQEKIKAFVDEAMQSPNMTYQAYNIRFIEYIEDKVMNYLKKWSQQYSKQENRTKLQIKYLSNQVDSMQDMFAYKKYFEQVVSSMFNNQETTKNLLMDACAKSAVRCDDPNCIEARQYCLSLTRDEVELLDALYCRHRVDAATAAEIYLDYWEKSSYTTAVAFLKEYERKKKQKIATGNNVRAQEDDLADILQNLGYIAPSDSGPSISKKATKKKQAKGKQMQPGPSSQEIKNRTNEIENRNLRQDSILKPLVRIPIGVSAFAQYRRVAKWESGVQELLDYFKNVNIYSYDFQYKNVNTTEERIKIEKRRHDLFPAEDILAQSDFDQYFVCNESQSQYYGLQHGYMAQAILKYQEGAEEKTKTGMVDIVVSSDKKKIFHQMFREDKKVENTLKCSMPAEEKIISDQHDAQDFIVVPDKRTGTTRSLWKNPNNNYYMIEFPKEETKDLCKTLYILPYKNSNG